MDQILQFLPGHKNASAIYQAIKVGSAPKVFVGNAMLTSPPLRNTPLKTKQNFGCELG